MHTNQPSMHFDLLNDLITMPTISMAKKITDQIITCYIMSCRQSITFFEDHN